MTAEELLNEAYDALDNMLEQQIAQEIMEIASLMETPWPAILPDWERAWRQVDAIIEKIEDFRVDGGEEEGLVKRFIDLRGQYTGLRFAWWDTVRDVFESFAGDQAWDTWAEFAEVCPPEARERYERLCPPWAFEPCRPTEEAERGIAASAIILVTDAPLPPLGAWPLGTGLMTGSEFIPPSDIVSVDGCKVELRFEEPE